MKKKIEKKKLKKKLKKKVEKKYLSAALSAVTAAAGPPPVGPRWQGAFWSPPCHCAAAIEQYNLII